MTAPPGPEPAYEQLRQVTAQAAVVLARNPSGLTLEGTNTWLLRDRPERDEAVVIDPGPEDADHCAAVAAAAGQVTQILLTHGHADHSAGAKALHELTGAPVRALDPTHRLGSEGLGGGDFVRSAGVELRILATAGHTSDSLSFVLVGQGRSGWSTPDGPGVSFVDADCVLTGDTVLGRGSSVIAAPDGDLAAYFDSLRRLADLGPVRVLPGHGPELPDAQAVAEAYRVHRRQRLDQVRAALEDLGLDPVEASVDAVVARVYADVGEELQKAVAMSVLAQLTYLERLSGPGGKGARGPG